MADKLRTLAMYLPQFHEVKENSEWWGEGFTEWTAVKQAEPLFDGHQQPRIPYEERYYNLLDKATMQWQAQTAKEYGVDGFCFYHYWFKDGIKILEKPAENLLKWQDIDMPFCFAWDSGSWARTWTKLGNAWADAFEPKNMDKIQSDGILLEQKYGDEAYWRIHFDYLLPFFKDSRYIRHEDKPVFIFYSSMQIPCFTRMVSAWRRWAKEEGFPDLYIIAFHMPDKSADAVILPMAFAISTLGYNEKVAYNIDSTGLKGYEYDEVWQDYLSYMPSQTNKTFWLGTVGFDDTPRRGLNGRLYTGESPSKFQQYFESLIRKSQNTQNPFVFIDAWNEWGEGKYLEPDNVHGYAYLQATRQAITNAKEQITKNNGFDNQLDWKRQSMMLEVQYLNKSEEHRMLTSWLRLSQDKSRLEKYLISINAKHISIYACGIFGKLLADSLSHTEITVDYFVDMKKEGLKQGEVIPIFSPDDVLPKCDLMVVSFMREFNEIYNDMKSRVDYPIISIFELVYAAETYRE